VCRNCFTVFVAEPSPAEEKSSAKKTLTKSQKGKAKSVKESAACTDTEVEKAQNAASCNEQKKRKRCMNISKQHSPACKLFTLPRSGLYGYLLAKLKRPAYLGKMRKQLVKHEGKVQCGKDVICIARKHLAKLLKLLDKIDNSDGFKDRQKQTARALSRVLQDAVYV